MAKFKVGDRVRVVHDEIQYCAPFDGKFGIVASDTNDHPKYPYLVFFEEGRQREFCDDELELIEAAPQVDSGDIIASGRILVSYETFAPVVLIGGTSINEKLRWYAREPGEFEVVIRRKEAK